MNPLHVIFPNVFHFKVTHLYVWRHAFKYRYYEASLQSRSEIGHYYEFGVYKMRSVVNFNRIRNISALWRKKLRDIRIFCFDSFQGLPEARDGDLKEDALWSSGVFSCSLEKAKAIAKKSKIKNIEFIKGYFSSSLTPDLKERLKDFPPGFVHIDCDLYSSTKDVLAWLDGFALPGAVLFFDDIWDYYAHPFAGEMKAILEYNQDDSKKGMLVEHPVSLGSRSVYAYVPRDPSEIARARKENDKAIPYQL